MADKKTETWRIAQPPIAEMMVPVRCLRCRRVYDLTHTEVIHRYSDCTLFYAPCCGARVDDRPEGWGGGIRRLSREAAQNIAWGNRRYSTDGLIFEEWG